MKSRTFRESFALNREIDAVPAVLLGQIQRPVGRLQLPDLQPLAIDNYDSGQLMLEAAAQGLGVAVMHASHFKEADDARLVRLFPETRVESPYRYYFVCRPRALQTRAVRIFRDWLIAADI